MAKPVVDGLERSLSGKVSLIRIDIQSEVGAELRRRYEIAQVPTFLLLDGERTERLRKVGRVPGRDAVLAAL